MKFFKMFYYCKSTIWARLCRKRR